MATITRLQTAVLAIPVDPPVWMSTRKLHTREYLLVAVGTDENVEGVGFTYAGTTGGATLKAQADLFGPRLIGRDVAAIDSIWHELYQEGLLIGRRGGLLRTLSAIDIALWDALGRLAGLPLARLLGGWQETVRAYASGGYYRPDKDLDGLARELSSYAELGFTDFKIKVGSGGTGNTVGSGGTGNTVGSGGPGNTVGSGSGVVSGGGGTASLRRDVARVRTARETIGPDARLALDANNAYATPAEALQASRAFEEFDIWWLEEPLSPDDVTGHAEIRARSNIPIATGEIEATRWGFRDLLAAGAADILQADAGVAGGISEWRRIAHTAASFNVPVAPHWHANLHTPLVAATHGALTVEYFPLQSGIFNFERIVAERLAPAGGRIPVPDRPGVGVVLDPRAVERYRVT